MHNISQSFYLQDGGKNQLEQNYVNIILCIMELVRREEKV